MSVRSLKCFKVFSCYFPKKQEENNYIQVGYMSEKIAQTFFRWRLQVASVYFKKPIKYIICKYPFLYWQGERFIFKITDVLKLTIPAYGRLVSFLMFCKNLSARGQYSQNLMISLLNKKDEKKNPLTSFFKRIRNRNKCITVLSKLFPNFRKAKQVTLSTAFRWLIFVKINSVCRNK